MRRTKLAVALACATAWALATAAPGMAAETAVGLTTDSPSTLVTFPVTDPGSAQTAAITFAGGAIDTNLVGLDHRPRSNQLYAYGSLGTLFVLNPPAMAGGPWSAVQVSAGLGAFPAGADTGLDVNPAADAIRVVNEANENYRFNPLNGNGGAGTAPGGPRSLPHNLDMIVLRFAHADCRAAGPAPPGLLLRVLPAQDRRGPPHA